MGIFDRMGKVISSNVNSLLEKAEDPRKLVELNLDEMGDQLKRGKQDVIAAVAAEKQLKKKAAELAAEGEKWEKRAELALKSGDEALAREALKQKKRVTGEAAAAEKARVEQRDLALKMKEELERMEQKLEELKLRKGTLVTRAEQVQGQRTGGAPGETLGARGGTSAFENFRTMEAKIEGKEAEAAAFDEVEEALQRGPSDRDLEAKFRDLERSTGGSSAGGAGADVEDELAALKKRIRV